MLILDCLFASLVGDRPVSCVSFLNHMGVTLPPGLCHPSERRLGWRGSRVWRCEHPHGDQRISVAERSI